MYVSDDVINALFVDNEFGESAFDKGAHKLFCWGILTYGLYLGAMYHAVSYAKVREVKSILEDFYLGIYILCAIALLYARLDEVVEVHFSKSLGGVLLVELDSKES